MGQPGGSRVGYQAAMRARDVSRPRPGDDRAETGTQTGAGTSAETPAGAAAQPGRRRKRRGRPDTRPRDGGD